MARVSLLSGGTAEGGARPNCAAATERAGAGAANVAGEHGDLARVTLETCCQAPLRDRLPRPAADPPRTQPLIALLAQHHSAGRERGVAALSGAGRMCVPRFAGRSICRAHAKPGRRTWWAEPSAAAPRTAEAAARQAQRTGASAESRDTRARHHFHRQRPQRGTGGRGVAALSGARQDVCVPRFAGRSTCRAIAKPRRGGTWWSRAVRGRAPRPARRPRAGYARYDARKPRARCARDTPRWRHAPRK